MPLLETKEVTIKLQSGEEKTYLLSKFPAIQGREIVTQYPLSAMPKVGDYKVNEEIAIKLLSFVAVLRDGEPLQLTTRQLIDNHIPDWETMARLEIAMMEYNCSFFANGRASTFFERIAQSLPQLISKILTDSLAQSSTKNRPATTNSEPSTP